MPDRADLLIERNHELLAYAAAACRQARQIAARMAMRRIERQEARWRGRYLPQWPPAPVTLWEPADLP